MLKYLFPGLRLVDKVPLLPRGYSSDHAARKGNDAHAQYLMGRTAARTEADAHRLLIKHSDKSPHHIANKRRREHRREPRWAKAWRKFKRLFN
jgi:hypothetical protein